MPIYRTCDCGQLHLLGEKCVAKQKADDRRRNQKRKTSGRNTPRWNRLRGLAIERAGNACADCGKVLPKALLHGHLDPRLKGDHHLASIDDVTVLCASCHGTRDAPRATRR